MRIILITVKLTNAGMLKHNFACKYYFLIAILKGEPRRFEPRPKQGKQANPVESFFNYLQLFMSSSMV
jgi:hypothetical protein